MREYADGFKKKDLIAGGNFKVRGNVRLERLFGYLFFLIGRIGGWDLRKRMGITTISHKSVLRWVFLLNLWWGGGACYLCCGNLIYIYKIVII